MENKNSNEPAFSKAAFYHPDGGIDPPQIGLTKREYFSGLANVNEQDYSVSTMEEILDEKIPESPMLERIKFFARFKAKLKLIEADEILKQLDNGNK